MPNIEERLQVKAYKRLLERKQILSKSLFQFERLLEVQQPTSGSSISTDIDQAIRNAQALSTKRNLDFDTTERIGRYLVPALRKIGLDYKPGDTTKKEPKHKIIDMNNAKELASDNNLNNAVEKAYSIKKQAVVKNYR